MAPARPNLLFLMTDHQRAGSLGTSQAGIEVTPNLNRLARHAAVFSRAYNTCPLCVPTRTALATGIAPTRNGVVCNDWKGATAGDHTPLHQCLAQAGYDVAHIGVDHIRLRPTLRERVPFTTWIGDAEHRQFLERQGIADALDRAPFRRAITENQRGRRVPVLYSNTRTAVWPHPAECFKDSYWSSEAVRFLSEPRPRPFALFLYLWAPHPPLIVPEPFASRFPPDRLDLPANVGQPAAGEPANRRSGIAAQLAEGIPIDQWRRVWAAHLGLVHLADAGIGRVLDALDAAGHADHTITLFTVDHGDHLGQHAMYQKMEMYEPAIHIPLVVRTPGGHHQAWDAPVSHLDVMPTLLELMGIDGPAGLDGLSLAQSIAGASAPPERPVFCQYSGNPAVGDIRRAVVTRRHKYIHDPTDEPELYDLQADPLEMHNLARDPSMQPTLDDLHALAADWAARHKDWVEF